MKRPIKYRHYAEIQANTPTRDDFNQKLPVWATIDHAYVDIEQLTGRSLYENQQVYDQVDTRIRTRFYPGLTPLNRIKYGSRTFQIIAVTDPEGRSIEHVVMCKEVPVSP